MWYWMAENWAFPEWGVFILLIIWMCLDRFGIYFKKPKV